MSVLLSDEFIYLKFFEKEKSMTLRKSPFKTCRDLKEHLQAVTGYPLETMKILHGGQVVPDHDESIFRRQCSAFLYVGVIPQRCCDVHTTIS